MMSLLFSPTAPEHVKKKKSIDVAGVEAKKESDDPVVGFFAGVGLSGGTPGVKHCSLCQNVEHGCTRPPEFYHPDLQDPW